MRSKLFLRRDRYGRFYSVLVYVPRDRHDTQMRHRIEAMLKRELDGEHVDTTVHIGESALAQLHLIVRPRPGSRPVIDEAKLEVELAHIVRDWQDELGETLAKRHGEELGMKLASGYARGCHAISKTSAPRSPRTTSTPGALSGADDCACRCTVRATAACASSFYRLNDDIPLSDALPMMENMACA